MNRYWIAFALSGNQNSGRKKTREEAVAWAADILGKHANFTEVNIAEVQTTVKRCTPSIVEEPLYVDGPVKAGNGQHDSLSGMDF